MNNLTMNNLLSDGYQIIEQLIDRQTREDLICAICDRLKQNSAYGVRSLHRKISLVNQFATSSILARHLTKYTNEQNFKLIKAIYFNKNSQHNWSVPWHQDKTIAVKNKVIVPDYKNWTIKQGVPHVQPPVEVLSKITTIRIALDDSDAANGGLKIIPGSHSLGVLNQKEIDSTIRQQTPVSLSLKAGDILMMRPLILHSSSKSISDRPRRVIHLEYSSAGLASELTWY